MGEYASLYGFYGMSIYFYLGSDNTEEGGESLKIMDDLEGFEFEILPSDFNGTSAIWVAQRIPDDHA